ncbi:5-deoxy-glucuronate isomerase [Sporosarcina sp. OR05]|uniref:5-deoxy-glucuronate isomerase n=1 Tax=Sporosarcina sp. OR05 TaxID=2969819 RepID=UPI00352B8B0C
MHYRKLDEINDGYTKITDATNVNSLMNIGIHILPEGKEIELGEEAEEQAILLLEGTIRLKWNGHIQEVSRKSVFEELPWCLHVPHSVKVQVSALEASEVLVQSTENMLDFDAKLYGPDECESTTAGEGVWDGTAQRVIRRIFDYENASHSNLVIGEVISCPGRWSSYPPHHHDQPEVYYYRFDKPQGFGCAMIGSNAYRIEHNSYIEIPGNLDHPQATAPGYAMYFCWMIRNIENNPWTERIFEDEHKWLLEPTVIKNSSYK